MHSYIAISVLSYTRKFTLRLKSREQIYVHNLTRTEPKYETSLKLSCYMTNAQSIYNKFYEFQAQVHQIQPKIIAITELWCNNLISDTEIQLDGYNMYRHDRNTTSGGGVLLYINQSLLSIPCTALNEQGYQELHGAL